jgi:hypothetical protein
MKKKMWTALAVGSFLIGNVCVANAYYLADGTDVGGYDYFLSSINMTPNDTNQLEWINLITKKNYTELTKSNTVSDNWAPIYTNDDGTELVTGGFAFELATYQPEYWLIKTGEPGSEGPNLHYLFKNEVSLDWAVLNLASEYISLSGVGRISHVTEVGGGTNPIPEPTTTMLFALGAIGFAGIARRRVSNK